MIARGWFALLLTCGACAGGTATNGGAGSPARAGSSIRAEDRVVIPSMTIVRSLAASDRYLFAATPLALGVYDLRFNEWRPPVTRVDGWPDLPVTVMLADPANPDAVWFAADNVVFYYRVGFHQVTRTLLPDRVSPNGFFIDGNELGGGVVVSTATGLMRVSPTGSVSPYVPPVTSPRTPATRARVVPSTVASVYAQFRTLRDFERLLTRDADLRVWPVMSAASTPNKSEAWLGTAGGGLFKVDVLFNRSEHLPFGLLGEGAGAVTRGSGGVWFGGMTSPVNPRGGLTFADETLRSWRWVDGGQASFLSNATVTAMSLYGSALWVATNRGLVRVDAQSGAVERRWDDGTGLPSTLVLAVEATDEGAWVGTSRGLAFVRDSLRSVARVADVERTMLMGATVRALTRRSDTLWIGTDAGVLALPPGSNAPRRLRAAPGDARLNLPISAIATYDSLLLIANANGEVLRISTRTGDVMDSVAFVSGGRVGRVNGLAIDATTIWVAGERGVLGIRRSTGVQQMLTAGMDLPAEAFGVTLTPQYVWIATRDGAVRVRRLSDGLVR